MLSLLAAILFTHFINFVELLYRHGQLNELCISCLFQFIVIKVIKISDSI